MKTLENSTKEQVSLDDYVCALTYISKNTAINKNPKLLFPTFQVIFQNSSIEKLRNVSFNDSPIYPFSEELYNSLFRLENSGILPYEISTQGSYYIIDEEKKSQMNFNQIDPIELEEIKILSSLFSNLQLPPSHNIEAIVMQQRVPNIKFVSYQKKKLRQLENIKRK